MSDLPSSAASSCVEKQQRCLAKSPFDREAADIVFTTEDGVDFRVYKAVLSLASPFFADMFSLAQHAEGKGENSNVVEPIQIQESSQTFDHLLRLCYPVPDPVVQDLAELELLLDAATKYQMEEALSISSRMLRAFVDSNPLQTFVVACRFGAEEEAGLAAAAWKRSYRVGAQTAQKRVTKGKKPLRGQEILPDYRDFASTFIATSYIPEMADISAGIFFRLLYYGRTDLDILPPFIKYDNSYPPAIRSKPTSYDEVEQWPIDPTDADVILRSVNGKEFPFHKILLRLSEATKLIDSGSTLEAEDGKLPIVQVGISSQVLNDLLRICLPSGGCVVEDTYRLWRLSRVALEYEMGPIVAAVKRQIQHKASTWPLSVYLITSQNGWHDDAASAARLLTEQVHIEDIYDPILEDVPTSAYFSLLKYHHKCVTAMSKVMRKHVPETTPVEWRRQTRYAHDTWPMYIPLPVAAREVERQMQRGTPTKTQRSCDMISTLISNGKSMENEIDDLLANVSSSFQRLYLCVNSVTDQT